MNNPNQRKTKNKVKEIKTYPIPFDLLENQENISIFTSNHDKSSKEQIINEAIQFHLKGDIAEASKCYQYCINKGLYDHRVFSNFGAILQSLGKLEEAEKYFRKAIELKPDFAEANYNMGIILKDLGKLRIAELSYRKAIEIKPNYAEAHYSLGIILKDLGKLQSAFNSYLKAIDINPTLSNIYVSITRFLEDSDPSQLNKSKLKYIINLLLEKNDIAHKKLFNAFNFLYKDKIINILEKYEYNFSRTELFINDKVIINALKKIIFCDVELEQILTKTRRKICHGIAKNAENINYSELQFIIALGEHCFLNEYVYALTEEENLSLKTILKRCKKNELNESNISILSCYFPLYKLLDQIP
tara:strand:- start:615 stop:1691 length:1077 start_codon:yes stop_codon:yes gene_type:complete